MFCDVIPANEKSMDVSTDVMHFLIGYSSLGMFG
jgi:hypothetical protein